jgi:hypothetical protein
MRRCCQSLYITIDIAIDIKRRYLMFRHWMRHTAMVPKGFLRFCVLKLLSEKPMAGSETMQEIENTRRGRKPCWKRQPEKSKL